MAGIRTTGSVARFPGQFKGFVKIIITMIIIRRQHCPGPGWRRVFATYVICRTSGRMDVPRSRQDFWLRE
jgi:hypothetical protein